MQGNDGYLYGTTTSGGTNNCGTVFKIDATGTLTNLHSFTGGNDGANPQGGIAQGSDGTLYGTAASGGASGSGTVFEISADGMFTVSHSFTSNGSDGSNPLSGLVQGSDGNFYGTTENGGVGRAGTVFRLTIVPEFQPLTLNHETLSLIWSTEAGGTYQLQYNSELSSTNWTNLNGPVTAIGATLNTTDSMTNGPQRFYRLRLLP
jgi:uncharacterized repeat protein (TIGR03803 family)